jgi:hypothetical protein
LPRDVRRPTISSTDVVLLCLVLVLLGNSGSMMSAGALPEGATLQLRIVATDGNGHDIIGKYVELRQNGTFVASGFIPYTFTVENSVEYQVGVADYHHYIFDHWADTGSTDRWRFVTITNNTTFVAVYKITVDNNAATSSSQGSGTITGTGGRGLTKAVIITTPENGDPVSPTGFEVSGVTIGNPTTVEIATRDPVTDVKTPYRAVNPSNPGDFTRWSYSLAVSNLAMTQVDVRALFSDGSQETNSVSVYYYTTDESGANTGKASPVITKEVKLQSSIRISDVGRPVLRVINVADSLQLTAAAQPMTAAAAGVADKNRSIGANDNNSNWPLDLVILIILGVGLTAFFVWLLARKRKVLTH